MTVKAFPIVWIYPSEFWCINEDPPVDGETQWQTIQRICGGHINLGIRARKTLMRMGIRTRADFLKATRHDFLEQRQCGKTTMRELVKAQEELRKL